MSLDSLRYSRPTFDPAHSCNTHFSPCLRDLKTGTAPCCPSCSSSTSENQSPPATVPSVVPLAISSLVASHRLNRTFLGIHLSSAVDCALAYLFRPLISSSFYFSLPFLTNSNLLLTTQLGRNTLLEQLSSSFIPLLHPFSSHTLFIFLATQHSANLLPWFPAEVQVVHTIEYPFNCPGGSLFGRQGRDRFRLASRDSWASPPSSALLFSSPEEARVSFGPSCSSVSNRRYQATPPPKAQVSTGSQERGSRGPPTCEIA
ncbi:hypothetical protein GE09DRAFT_755616 [Coniochaeta sp. 2T2.1]|nr:hypothetical protein GE09DRAFT_755616 [Coniochaeta sp. 2T2.1]